MRPIIKWAGGKSQLIPQIKPLIPEFNTYYEPFLGGGAIYFYLAPQQAVLNDFNPQLINLYNQCKKDCDDLKDRIDFYEKNHRNTNDYYLQKRKEYNECLRKDELSINSAALLLYLNKAGFNGLYRLNSSGQFNVPSAHREQLHLFDEDNFNAVSNQLNHAELKTGDFEQACSTCKKNDFVFFDSPYYKTFDSYQAQGFSQKDHERLFDLFCRLSQTGVKCLLTNSNEKFITELYKGFNIRVVDVKRMINCDGEKRTGQEVIITNY